MFKNMQEEERVIDFNTLDLHNDFASLNVTWAVEFLARKLQKAMANLALQNMVQTQLQARTSLSEACKEAIWLGWLVTDLGIKEETPMLHCVSQSAIQLARNPVYHSKTKHVDVKYHFI
ncbi:hypothetical protein L7F22_058161 [Adiantum nelumboides]|nr:hypothetical protein [Adiantum nelumboides]